MTNTGLLALELRRVLLSVAVGVACWMAIGNPYIGAAVTLLMLLSLWGWQLSRLYRWFANPDEMPPLGDAAVRGILRDVYLLRSRGLARESAAPATTLQARETFIV